MAARPAMSRTARRVAGAAGLLGAADGDHGDARRFDFREDDDDYYSQPGVLFRHVQPEEKRRLFENTASRFGPASKVVRDRHVANCTKADPAHGEGVEKALEEVSAECAQSDVAIDGFVNRCNPRKRPRQESTRYQRFVPAQLPLHQSFIRAHLSRFFRSITTIVMSSVWPFPRPSRDHARASRKRSSANSSVPQSRILCMKAGSAVSPKGSSAAFSASVRPSVYTRSRLRLERNRSHLELICRTPSKVQILQFSPEFALCASTIKAMDVHRPHVD